MTKVYEHAVIYNGVLYPANTPIEVKEEKQAVKKETVKKSAKKTVKNDDTTGTV